RHSTIYSSNLICPSSSHSKQKSSSRESPEVLERGTRSSRLIMGVKSWPVSHRAKAARVSNTGEKKFPFLTPLPKPQSKPARPLRPFLFLLPLQETPFLRGLMQVSNSWSR